MSYIHPIGIFDSGIGGLTVAKAVVEQLPQESIIYFGDTIHLPYGDKSAATIQSYSLKIVEMLLKQNCKLILIACNSISAAASEVIHQYVAGRALLVNVIDPLVTYLQANYANKRVGLIATRQTVKSNVYQKKLELLRANIKLQSLATPMLVHAIEEGFSEHKLIDDLLEEYLSREVLRNIDALILGCTHYPILKKSINDFYHGGVEIIEASSIVAGEVRKQLEAHDLLNKSNILLGNKHFYISDHTEAFAKNAKLFFGDDIKLECCSLWE